MDTLYKKLLLAMALILCGPWVLAQHEVSKQLEQDYPMAHSGELYLQNRYGIITVTGWEQEKVSIVAQVTVTHRKKENAKNLLDRISLNTRDMGNLITVNSEIAEKSSGFFAKYFNKANPFDFDRSNVRIDLTVHLPRNAELDITNKFGDVIVGDWTGRLKAAVEHGDVWINENLKNVDLSLKYGKLRAKNIDYGNLRIKNGGLDLEKSKDLRINCSGTNIKADSIASLEIYSNKDEITLNEVGVINGDLKFTNMQLGAVGDQIHLSMKIADFRVSKIYSPNVTVVLEQESSEVSLNISGLSFMFDATLEEGLLRLPKSFTNVSTTMLDKGKSIREIKAHYGQELSGTVTITGKKGIVLLKEL